MGRKACRCFSSCADSKDSLKGSLKLLENKSNSQKAFIQYGGLFLQEIEW